MSNHDEIEAQRRRRGRRQQNAQKLPTLMKSANNFSFMLENEDQQLIAEARDYAQSYTSIFGHQVPPALLTSVILRH